MWTAGTEVVGRFLFRARTQEVGVMDKNFVHSMNFSLSVFTLVGVTVLRDCFIKRIKTATW